MKMIRLLSFVLLIGVVSGSARTRISGKILTVWQKKSGQWRIVAQSGNVYDSPAK